MATWTNITNAALEPGKPIRSVDGLALRDNPVAITEGASGAPKIQNAAMDDDTVDDRLLTGTATTVGRDWVLARTALSAVGSVGSYAFMANRENVVVSAGDTQSAASLDYANAFGNSEPGGPNPSGSWRCMGYAAASSATNTSETATLFLRIA